jgi:hypothetical protein
MKLVRAKSVAPLEGFRVHVVFDNAEEREIDLERYLRGPVFEPIREDQQRFRSVTLERGVLTWHCGDYTADIDPDVLYYELTPAGMEDVEPAHS